MCLSTCLYAPSSFHHTPSLVFSFAQLLTPTFICLYVGKKRRALFFPHALCCLWLICPRPVSCVLLSHQWNIDESTEHVSNPHVWSWGVLQGRFLFPLRVGVAVCVLVDFELYMCVCVCVFISNPPGIHFYERSKPHQIHSKKRVTSSLVHHKLRVSNRPTASVEEGGGGIISPETAHRSNIPTFYHKTTSESTLGRSVASQALTAAPIQRFLPSLST